MGILIATPSLHSYDAVSNDVMQLKALLSAAGEEVSVYSEFCDPKLESALTERNKFVTLLNNPKNTLIYHHSVQWVHGEEIINASSCRIFLKYHNITPSNFFSYDPVRMHITAMGREQTKRFIESKKIECFIGDSHYNSQELIHNGAAPDRTHVIAPFHCVHDFDNVEKADDLSSNLKDGKHHILFVGRVAPNKGHKHLFRTLSRFVDFYGSKIHLHIVGGILEGDRPYLTELENLINELGIASIVSFHNKLSFRELHTYYNSVDAFLLMSEHEGFCVPILEAQYHNLPIVAWDQCAVGETMGSGQIVLPELDYETFAVALHRVITDPQLKKNITEIGLENFRKYEARILFKRTQELIYG